MNELAESGKEVLSECFGITEDAPKRRKKKSKLLTERNVSKWNRYTPEQQAQEVIAALKLAKSATGKQETELLDMWHEGVAHGGATSDASADEKLCTQFANIMQRESNP